jgi:hypothetical protein
MKKAKKKLEPIMFDGQLAKLSHTRGEHPWLYVDELPALLEETLAFLLESTFGPDEKPDGWYEVPDKFNKLMVEMGGYDNCWISGSDYAVFTFDTLKQAKGKKVLFEKLVGSKVSLIAVDWAVVDGEEVTGYELHDDKWFIHDPYTQP